MTTDPDLRKRMWAYERTAEQRAVSKGCLVGLALVAPFWITIVALVTWWWSA